jgi:hypothetical protein
MKKKMRAVNESNPTENQMDAINPILHRTRLGTWFVEKPQCVPPPPLEFYVCGRLQVRQ